MNLKQATLVMIPIEELIYLKTTLSEVLELLKELPRQKSNPTQPGYVTAKEFMAAVKIGRTKFDQLVQQSKIRVIKKRRKIYLPAAEINRFFTDASIR